MAKTADVIALLAAYARGVDRSRPPRSAEFRLLPHMNVRTDHGSCRMSLKAMARVLDERPVKEQGAEAHARRSYESSN